jgi:hypothetical protein
VFAYLNKGNEMIRLAQLLHKNFGKNTVIDRIFDGKLEYSKLDEIQGSAMYSEGWFLLREYKVNLKNVYKDVEKHSDVYGVFYSFRDKKDNIHYTRVSKDFVVKIGPAVDNSVVNGKILTKKRNKFNDAMILNTHISNLLMYVEQYKPNHLSFVPETTDGQEEARRRLFTSLAGNFPEKIEDIKVSGDEIFLYLKY